MRGIRNLKVILVLGGMVGSGLAAPVAMAKDGGVPTLAQALGNPDGLNISATMRARYEAIDGQFRPGLDDSSDAVLLQTDIAAEYDSGPVRVGGEVMDSRAYGGGKGSSLGTSEVNALEMVQAYVGFDLGAALGKGSTLTVDAGRFTMDLGSRRLVARNNFRNTTNAFDGFKAQFRSAGGQSATLFYTLPLTRLPDDKADILDNVIRGDRQSFDLTFWGAFASTPLPLGKSKLEGYFLGLDEGDSPEVATRNRHLRTVGGRLYRKAAAKSVDYDVEGAYQFGNVRAGTAATAAQLDVSAWFVHAGLGYSFGGSWSPRLSLEYDGASGDRPGGAYGRFDNLYGARRSEFGPTSLYGAFGRNNISSPGIRLEVKPDKRWDAFAMYRAAWLESASDSFASTGVRDPQGDAGKFAGHQIEARVRYWLVPARLQLETGGAALVAGRFLDDAAGASGNGDTLYGYFSVLAKL
jgi:hypothetical protein